MFGYHPRHSPVPTKVPLALCVVLLTACTQVHKPALITESKSSPVASQATISSLWRKIASPGQNEVALSCEGRYTVGDTKYGSKTEVIRAKVTLKKDTFAGTGFVAKLKGPPGGTLPLDMLVLDHQTDESPDEQPQDNGENYSSADRWYIVDNQFWANSRTTAVKRFILNRTGQMQFTYTDPHASMDNESFFAQCRRDAAAERASLAEEQAAKEEEEAVEQNPFLSAALGIRFEDAPVCANLRAQLIKFSQTPNLSSLEWQRYYDELTNVAARANCLTQ